MPPRDRATARWPLIAAAALLVSPACKRQHYTVDQAPELAYPTCPAGVDMAPQIVAAHTLRSGAFDTRQSIVEHYRIEKRGCLYAAITRQEWPVQIAEVEILYTAELEPLRIWRRLTIPGSRRPDGNADTKRFDFRTPEITTKQRDDKGAVSYEILRGPGRPRALVGPGRGMLSMWLKRAKLAPGQKVREPVLDFRGIEKISPMTLQRLPDQHLDWLGRTARVYTFLGREAIFADEDDNVIGDLAGLVLDEKAPTPRPRAMPAFEAPDPIGTP